MSVSGWHPFDAIAALRAEGHGQATKAALKLTTSGPQHDQVSNLTIYLKPTNDTFQIRLARSSKMVITVAGQEVMDKFGRNKQLLERRMEVQM